MSFEEHEERAWCRGVGKVAGLVRPLVVVWKAGDVDGGTGMIRRMS